MKGLVIKRALASVDIEEIAATIGENNPNAAERFLQSVEKGLELLSSFPELGPRWEADDPRLQGLRLWVVKGFRNHVLIYRPNDDGIELLRVVHGARDLENLYFHF